MIIRRQKTLTRPMNRWLLLAGLLVLVVGGCAHSVATAAPQNTASSVPASPVVQPLNAAADDYLIGAGDVLEISVWKDPALTRQVVVLPDGTIAFPLVGQVSAAGKRVETVKQEMEKKLKRFIPEPDLSLIVQQVNSLVVYVIGKVNRPGQIPLNRNIDVLQALAMAGGLNVFANREDIRIFRKSGDQTMVIPFNYTAVTEDNRLEGNILLQRGDVVVVK